MKLLQSLLRTRSTEHRIPDQSVYDKILFRELLRRERLRADRSGSRFSLLVFTPRTSADSPVSDSAAMTAVRATDYVGPLDGKLAVLLCETDRAGATACLRRLKKAGIGNECDVAVLEYPEADGNNDQRSSDDRRTGNSADGREADLLESIAVGGGFDNHAEAVATDRVAPLFTRKLARWKRTLDIIGSSSGLVVLSPLFAVIAIATRCESPGPIIFRQPRRGVGNREFQMYKFRSMVEGAEGQQDELRLLNEQDGPAFKIKDDPRVTRVGAFLRKSCLDELPQLVNVLRGDMTIVGPRPLPVQESDKCNGWYRRRLDVTPGLTCIWQVDGKSRVTFEEWMRMDMRYLNSQSALLDLKLIARTLLLVIRRKASH